jgi:hypothetical protein
MRVVWSNWGCALVCCLVILSTTTANAATVKSTMGVLAYTMDASCPTGWQDLSWDLNYKGRLIKSWNPADNLGIGAQHLPNDPSKGNNIITHTHARFARTIFVPDVSARGYSTGTFQGVLQGGITVTLTESNTNAKISDADSQIQSEFDCCTIPSQRSY